MSSMPPDPFDEGLTAFIRQREAEGMTFMEACLCLGFFAQAITLADVFAESVGFTKTEEGTYIRKEASS